jgi:hypothetical protein
MQVLNKGIFQIIVFLFFQINIANACTNFCMDTPKGPIFGSNLDLLIPGDGLVFINRKGISKKGLYPGTTGKTINWVSKYGSVSFNMGGREMAFAGKRNINFKTSGEPNAIKYAFETLTKKVAEPNTKWNIVYDIKQRQVFFRSEASPTLKYFSFKDFDFSCSAPSLMLDINSAIEGDVSKYFIPYDYNINLKIFKTLCDRYNLNVSLKAAEDLVKHLERFKCTALTHVFLSQW